MSGRGTIPQASSAVTGSGRLSKANRRRQLLDTALAIIRKEGADRLTLGHLAARAGVSKPIAYEHFGTRTGLLIALYRSIDQEHADALHDAVDGVRRPLDDTAAVLAAAYVHCSAQTMGDWQAVGAALSGSQEKDAVQRELLDGYVRLFVSALEHHSALEPDELQRRCVGLIGAGEALSAMMIAGSCSEKEAADAFSSLIQGGLRAPSQP